MTTYVQKKEREKEKSDTDQQTFNAAKHMKTHSDCNGKQKTVNKFIFPPKNSGEKNIVLFMKLKIDSTTSYYDLINIPIFHSQKRERVFPIRASNAYNAHTTERKTSPSHETRDLEQSNQTKWDQAQQRQTAQTVLRCSNPFFR